MKEKLSNSNIHEKIFELHKKVMRKFLETSKIIMLKVLPLVEKERLISVKQSESKKEEDEDKGFIEIVTKTEAGSKFEDIKVESGKSKREIIKDIILKIASERTGYPVDMLDPSLDMEADLGIDSIKRAEMMGNFQEKAPGLFMVLPEMQEISMAEIMHKFASMDTMQKIAGAKTLNDLIDLLDSVISSTNR